MRHRVDPRRSWGRVRALTGVVVALSFLVVSAAEASHSHAGAVESAATCSVCQLGHRPAQTTGPYTPDLTGRSLLKAPALAGHMPAPAAVHLSPPRSRAPPLHLSL